MNIGNDSKLVYEQGEEGPRLQSDLISQAQEYYGSRHEYNDFPFPNPTNTAVRSHLRAAIHALNEHDCDSVRRHIEEAMGLL